MEMLGIYLFFGCITVATAMLIYVHMTKTENSSEEETGVLLWSIILTAAAIFLTRDWVFTESIQKLDVEWVSGNVNLNR